MLKKFTSFALAGLCFTAFSTTAMAQGEDEWSTDEETTVPADTTTTTPAANTAGGDAEGFKMGISVSLFDLGINIPGSGSAGGSADILYGLDADTFLDLEIGVNFGPGGQIDDPANPGNTIQGDDVFGLEVGAPTRLAGSGVRT